MPDTRLQPSRDRARGALLGLAVGDAVGTTLEFTVRDSYEPLTDMTGGGPFHLRPGEWTDDTAMALALADSLLSTPEFTESDLMSRFCDWQDHGTYSCTGHCFDIGNTVLSALDCFRRTGSPVAGSTNPHSAGNGSLMRLAPVPIRFATDSETRIVVSRRQSATTHGASEAIAACEAYSELIADAILGERPSYVLRPRTGNWPQAVNQALSMEPLSRPRNRILASGYVIHSLEAALWAVGNAKDFKEAILLAANLGDDADTTAAITGQLAGALWGANSIPQAWLDCLAWRDQITNTADRLFALSLQQQPTAHSSPSKGETI